MKKKLFKEVKRSFKSQFNTAPLYVFAPGRINLIGEHTDYNDGFAFPAAINKGIVLALSKSDTNYSTVYALNKEERYDFEAAPIAPISGGGWRNYVIGVIAEIQKLGKTVGHFQSVFAGDIPGGAGMSSSAALENAFVFGLNALFDLELSKQDMIFISQRAEHHFAGVKCGIMDQYASMFGVKNSALLLDCRSITATTHSIDFSNYTLLLINTNVTHDLSESAYNNRRDVCEKVSQLLGVTALREASKTALDGIKSSISAADYQKALYIINENRRVLEFSKAIAENDVGVLGNLMYQSHEGLSTDYQVSCPELDFLVNYTTANPQVIGARMMGGGFGGCTINLIEKTAVSHFKKDVSAAYKNHFSTACSIYRVKLGQGTHLVKQKKK